MRIPLQARASAAAHVLLAAVHCYWATGATWPAANQRELSEAVLGMEVSFAPRVVLPLAAFHLVLAAAVITRTRPGSGRLVRRVVLGLIAGLALRTGAGVLWSFGLGTATGTAFYWLNLVVYTPLCLALLLADLSLVRSRRRVLVEDFAG